jgi:hypothetical protein
MMKKKTMMSHRVRLALPWACYGDCLRWTRAAFQEPSRERFQRDEVDLRDAFFLGGLKIRFLCETLLQPWPLVQVP